MIRKKGDEYCLYSKKKGKDGKRKNLGCYSSRAGAEKREREVQYFKHMGESEMSVMKSIKAMVKEELEEAMGKKSRATKQPPDATKDEKKAANKRVRKAGKKEAEEQSLDEKEMTKPEIKKRDKIYKALDKEDIVDRYGKDIRGAIATSTALKEEEELYEFDLGTIGKLAGGAANLLSSENFRRTAMQLFLRMAEKELTQHLRQSADGIAQSIVPDIPFDGDILESLMQRKFSEILTDKSDELAKAVIDLVTNAFIEKLMGDPNIREHLAEAMGRASKVPKTPPDATKDEKKAANKRARKAAKEDSKKKDLDEAQDPIEAAEDAIEAMPEDQQEKLLSDLMSKLEGATLEEEEKKNPVVTALTKLPGGRDLAAIYFATLDRDTPTKLRIMAALAILNLIAPGDIGTLMGLDFLGPLAALDDYLLVRRMMKKYKKAGLPSEKHHDQVQMAAGEKLSPERAAERELENLRESFNRFL